MPIRGIRNPMPSKGGTPTGIFSTRGKQKTDSTSSYGHKNLVGSMSRDGGEISGKPKGDDRSLRHQKPKNWS